MKKILLILLMASISSGLFAQIDFDSSIDHLKINADGDHILETGPMIIGYGSESNAGANDDVIVRDNIVVGTSKGIAGITDPLFNNGRGLFVGNAGSLLDANNGTFNIIGRVGFNFYTNESTQAFKALSINASGNMGIGDDPENNVSLKVYEDHLGTSGTGILIKGPTGSIPNMTLQVESSPKVNFRYHSDNSIFQIQVRDNVDNYPVVLSVNDASQMAIGPNTPTPSDTDYKLAIGGKIISEESKVRVQSEWPDYVFTPEYELTPLDKLEQEVQELGHLPNIPSAEQVAEDGGILLGEMNAKLLEKVEEITLHLFDMNESIKNLQQENDQLKRELKKLK